MRRSLRIMQDIADVHFGVRFTVEKKTDSDERSVSKKLFKNRSIQILSRFNGPCSEKCRFVKLSIYS